MAENTAFKWKRQDIIAELKIKREEDDTIVFDNEGYVEISKTERAEIIYLKFSGEFSGKLCVNEDDPLHRCAFVAQPEGHDGPNNTPCKYYIDIYHWR